MDGAMKVEEGTCGFVLEADDHKFDCQICLAELELRGEFACEANAGDYEFIAVSGGRIFVCAECFKQLFTAEHKP